MIKSMAYSAGIEPTTTNRDATDWWPIAAGLVILYAPVFYTAANSYWQTEESAHGPIIAVIVTWLIWQKRTQLIERHCKPATSAGIPLLLLGLLFYVVGTSMDVALFQIGALIPILTGSVLAMRGWRAVRALWFPLLFIVFMIPLPGTFTDALTGPLKQHVSVIAEQLLYAAGYPIGRTGVTLTVGQYQLLVADACSGLNTMFSLSALGMLFMYLTARTSRIHNAIMLASILPIAFVSNVIRVLVLILITYHFGDEAGQGYLHGAAGIVLLIAALAAFLGLDSVLVRLLKMLTETARA